MKRKLLRLMHTLGAGHVARFIWRRKLLVLAYHGFLPEEESGDMAPLWGIHVPAKKFESQLAYLRKYYAPVSLETALSCLEGGRPLPDNAVVITMDDGYRSVRDIAFPLLLKYEIPATVFLTTGFLDGEAPLWVDRLACAVVQTDRKELAVNIEGVKLEYDLNGASARQACVRDLKTRLKTLAHDKLEEMLAAVEVDLGGDNGRRAKLPEPLFPLDWDQVREMRQSGLMTFGAHTRTHVILSGCTEEVSGREIRHSRLRLEQELQTPCRYFAYPNGGAADHNEISRRVLAADGFRCAFLTVPGLVTRGDDLLTLRRVSVLNWMDTAAFALQISLVLPALRRQLEQTRPSKGKVPHVAGCA
ncbi:MAG: polysaccharide deacetylase family protein [Candidatus Omnitrophica bacterium]|nr:polysaccharide deacetylase family protein [Candidatus Omnitrophota bacterium]